MPLNKWTPGPCNCECTETTYRVVEVFCGGCNDAGVGNVVVTLYDDISRDPSSFVSNAASDPTGIAYLTVPDDGRTYWGLAQRYSFNDAPFTLEAGPGVHLTPAEGFHCMTEFPDCGLPAKDVMSASVTVPGYGSADVDITYNVIDDCWYGVTAGIFGGACTDFWEGCGEATTPEGSAAPPYDVAILIRWSGGPVVLFWSHYSESPGLDPTMTPCPAAAGLGAGFGGPLMLNSAGGDLIYQYCGPTIATSNAYSTGPILWDGDYRLCFDVSGTATVTE